MEQTQYCFKEEYQYYDSKIELNNRYQASISSYVCEGEREGEENFIHIDELYEAGSSFFFSVHV